ncbi:hypothetical protein C2S51_021785 [Perilla frutescens var. frutescens]|nr:hypothetical protein C2S51_021785 [Perilla frutescens var. frutescens]
MGGNGFLLSILALNFFVNIATSSPLKDFCVADFTSSLRLDNGFPCVDPAKVEVDNFFFSGLHLAGNLTNPGSTGTTYAVVYVNQIPGLNTQGMSIARVDIAVNGIIAPHYNLGSSQIVTVLEGSMEVGFVTSSPDYRHFRKVLEKGDVFGIPEGLVHYTRNVGAGNVVFLAALNTESPRTTYVPHVLLEANPGIDAGFLSRVSALK